MLLYIQIGRNAISSLWKCRHDDIVVTFSGVLAKIIRRDGVMAGIIGQDFVGLTKSA